MRYLRSFAGAAVSGDLELLEMTSGATPACHVYMEAQVFTPDSRRMVIHQSAHPHGSDPLDPEHRYLCCDLESLERPWELTREVGATALAISPDGEWFYYFVGSLEVDRGVIRLRRVRLDGTGREELFALDHGPSGRFYPLSTISSDGKRLAIATNLAGSGGQSALWCFDLERGTARMLLHGMNFGNLHMQYCRSPEQPHLLMIQQNHGCLYDAAGKELRAYSAALDGGVMRNIPLGATPDDSHTGLGIDLHLLDDRTGEIVGSFPVGRNGDEFCQGHQCWRGQSEFAISSTIRFVSPSSAIHELVECRADSGENHHGAAEASGNEPV